MSILSDKYYADCPVVSTSCLLQSLGVSASVHSQPTALQLCRISGTREGLRGLVPESWAEVTGEGEAEQDIALCEEQECQNVGSGVSCRPGQRLRLGLRFILHSIVTGDTGVNVREQSFWRIEIEI